MSGFKTTNLTVIAISGDRVKCSNRQTYNIPSSAGQLVVGDTVSIHFDELSIPYLAEIIKGE